jgi:hypothetical protein
MRRNVQRHGQNELVLCPNYASRFGARVRRLSSQKISLSLKFIAAASAGLESLLKNQNALSNKPRFRDKSFPDELREQQRRIR